MNNRWLSKIAAFFFGVLSSWLLVAGYYPGSVVEASCPTFPRSGWARNIGVYYNTPAGHFTPTELSNIQTAISEWSIHNVWGGNCSNVPFGYKTL
jgi:hypothetical protein